MIHRTKVVGAVVLSVFVLSPAPGDAQALRFEPGLRLRALERAWLETEDPERRREALGAVEHAVQAFFSLRLDVVARQLDVATYRLRGRTPSWADSLSVLPARRILSGADTELECAVRSLYDGDAPPAGAWLEVDVAGVRHRVPLRGPPETVRLPLPRFAESDLRLAFALGDSTERRRWRDTISRVEAPRRRLAELRRAAGTRRAGTARSTVIGRVGRLELLVGGDHPEVMPPALRWIRECESLVADQTPPWSAPGDHWIVLATPTGHTPTRLFVPESASCDAASSDVASRGIARPLVIAAHGMGGSENLFFDGYGVGLAVRLCRQRGWILAAPSMGLLGRTRLEDVVTAVAEIVAVDRTRVVAVGHSMGARSALRAVSRAPGRFRSLALLGGGGGAIAESPAVAGTRFFLAAGSRDFGRGMVGATRRRLAGLGIPFNYRLVPDCEHLLVVAEALPEVFRFFEADGWPERDL